MTVRVRLAPSLTDISMRRRAHGHLNWLFAKRHNGTFIIRASKTPTRPARRTSPSRFSWKICAGCARCGTKVRMPRTACAPSAVRANRNLRPLAAELMKGDVAYRCYCTEEELSRNAKRRRWPGVRRTTT